MKLRAQYDRRYSSESRRLLKRNESSSVMQTNSNEHNTQAGNGLSLTLQPEILTRTPAAGAVSSPSETGEVRVPISVAPGETSGRPASRRPRAGGHSHSHSHSHSHNRPHSHSEPESDPGESDSESGEPSTSLSELRYLFRWVQKSLPFIVILCAKLVIQHALGLAVGVGLFTTFLYANKTIQNQVFLQDRRSKLECVWLLTFLTLSTLLLYYTFHAETLLIFVSPSVEALGLWEVLWTVGVTSFIVKFLFMGLKCLILLVPSSFMTYRSRGRWYMLTEEIGQVYQAVAPMPVWFRFLVTYHEVDGIAGLTLGILLALVYLILKQNGTAATKSQCSEAGDVCPICQVEFRDPRVLLCQHIFCDECISLWFNREKTCPLCRTVITDKVHKWKDGATSPYLQIY
ncbi:hypothetical protein JZ751_023093 [Albula glossodonta]|uniref:E3 ubiquitin-protein ligase RNFT1 n=1 Tax=Albula glossodonta TaxID=121402 RepID=A0A8T2PMN1_9TELE|nr:hypothetical protein JZ751_023093 [Albula glossodonta]